MFLQEHFVLRSRVYVFTDDALQFCISFVGNSGEPRNATDNHISVTRFPIERHLFHLLLKIIAFYTRSIMKFLPTVACFSEVDSRYSLRVGYSVRILPSCHCVERFVRYCSSCSPVQLAHAMMLRFLGVRLLQVCHQP